MAEIKALSPEDVNNNQELKDISCTENTSDTNQDPSFYSACDTDLDPSFYSACDMDRDPGAGDTDHDPGAGDTDHDPSAGDRQNVEHRIEDALKASELNEALDLTNGAIAFVEKDSRFRTCKVLKWADRANQPYMRLLHWKALVLERRGEVKEAADVAKRLLQLNPTDEQRISGLLVTFLILLRNYKDARRIVRDYIEFDDCVIAWSDVLLSFVSRDSEIMLKLKRALEINVLVPGFLLNAHRIPEKMNSKRLTEGGRSEALSYAMYNRRCWTKAAGALDWLSDCRLSKIPARDDLMAALREHQLLIVFRKVTDKAVREMQCTKNLHMIPPWNHPTEKKTNHPTEEKTNHPTEEKNHPTEEDVEDEAADKPIRVFEDMTAPKGEPDWRSFYYESILEVPFYDVIVSE